jgi:hypothetical protein
MAATGMTVPDIHRNLLDKNDGLCSWTLDFLKNHFKIKDKLAPSDATDLRLFLQSRKDLNHLKFFWEEDSEGRVDLVFAEVEGGMSLYNKMVKEDCTFVMFDSTHGTAIVDAKLCLFVSVNAEGMTVILGIGLIIGNENASKFTWLFNRFFECFGNIKTFMSDSCSKIQKGLEDSEIKVNIHLLCIWHVFKNFQERNSCLGNLRTEINQKFWIMAKSTRVCDNEAVFNEEFGTFVTAVEDALVANRYARDHDVVKWLNETLKPKARKCFYRFTSKYFKVGCYSTQRQESIHNAIKNWMNRQKVSLKDLFYSVLAYTVTKDFECASKVFKFEAKVLRFAQNGMDSAESYIVKHLRDQQCYSVFALEKLKFQYGQSQAYRVQENPNKKFGGW